MHIGFIGTGKITSSIIYGIFKSKLKITKIYISPRNRAIANRLSKKFMTSDNVLVTRERHRAKLKNCLKEIDNFLKKDQNKDIEIAAEDLRLATRHLGGIVGKVDVEEILDSIFKDFCIGK